MFDFQSICLRGDSGLDDTAQPPVPFLLSEAGQFLQHFFQGNGKMAGSDQLTVVDFQGSERRSDCFRRQWRLELGK